MRAARVSLVSSRNSAAGAELVVRVATALLMTVAAAIVLIHAQARAASPDAAGAPVRSAVVCAEISC
jgi:hypothetical protein